MNHSNASPSTSLPKDVSAGDIVLVIIALVASVSIVSVNSVTIIVIKKTHQLQTLSNMYIVSLATADLIIGLCLVPTSVFYVPHIRRNYYNRNVNMCVLLFGINLGMAVVSTLHMTLIATDRYLYIVWPYLYEKTVHRKVICMILGCTWIFGVCYALLPQLIHQEAFTKCALTTVMPIGYLFYSNASIYVLCSVVDVAMYSQILLTANRQRRVIRSNSQSVDIYTTDGSLSDSATDTTKYNILTICFNKRQPSVQNQVIHLSNPERFQQNTTMHNEQNTQPNIQTDLNNEHNINTCRPGRSPRTNIPSGRMKNRADRMKSVRFFMIVFGVYFICLTPTVACMGINYYQAIPRLVYNLLNLLAFLNSGMNFIIFFVLNRRFRTSVLKLCRCGTFAKHLNSNDAPFFDS